MANVNSVSTGSSPTLRVLAASVASLAKQGAVGSVYNALMVQHTTQGTLRAQTAKLDELVREASAMSALLAPNQRCRKRHAKPVRVKGHHCTQQTENIAHSVVQGVSPTQMERHARAVFRRRTRTGTVRTARHAFDARRVISPIFSAQAAMRAWASTHRMVGNAWTVLLATSHRVCLGPLAARAAVTLA